MDCKKIGQLILQLRKERGLTQKQVAEKLNITNKTISKWECGNGCPDVTLWGELSAILGADILKLLEGELKPNIKDVGKIDKVRFYVCPKCGNILISTSDAAISCCGRKLSALKSIPATDEHKMNIEQIEMEYYITVDHEMSKSHYIYFAAYVHYDTVLLLRLYPEQNPSFYLPVMKSKGNLYLYCTEHGLQKYPLK